MITMEKLVEREYRMPEPQTGARSDQLLRQAHRPGREVAVTVRSPGTEGPGVLGHKSFRQTVELEGAEMIQAISSNVARFLTVHLFVKALRALVLEEQEPQLVAERRISEKPPFPYSRTNAFPASKTIFNLAACDNAFEERFARFLQNASDATAFAKLPPQFGFAIECTDSAASLRYYQPDFVAILADHSHRLIETKGREDPDVAHKDRAAELWCENATLLTKERWRYVKVPQAGFDRLQPTSFTDLVVFEG